MHTIARIVVATRNTSVIAGSTGGWQDGTGTTARFFQPSDVAVSSDLTTLYVSDTGNGAVRRMNLLTNAVTTLIGMGCTPLAANCDHGLAGCCSAHLLSNACSLDTCYAPGTGTSASFANNRYLMFSTQPPFTDSAGGLFASDDTGTISAIDLSASPPAMSMLQCLDPAGGSCTSCTSAGCASYSFVQSFGISLDAGGALFVAVSSSPALWQCTLPGSLSALASCSRLVGTGIAYPYCIDVDTDGNCNEEMFSGEWTDETSGAPLTAGLIGPRGVTTDTARGITFFSDGNVLRKYQSNQVVTFAGGRLKAIPGVTSSNLPSCPFPTNCLLPLAGSFNAMGTNAAFSAPSSVDYNAALNALLVSDTENGAVKLYFL